jgi:hypothetical protein
MAPLPTLISPTIAAIWAKYEADQETGYRSHLGASQIGHPCSRALWYTFRWATKSSHKGRILRLFQTGHMAEARMVKELRSVGVEVHMVDEATGRQFTVVDETGHFGGSMDGVALGIHEAPKTWHVLEFKTHGEKSFGELLKKGVASKPMHVAQMLIYMHLTGMTRAFYMAVNKNTDDIYAERIHANPEAAIRLIAKAQAIINAPRPPERISDDPAWFECRFCDHRDVCHGDAVPEAHCRSCMFSTPIDDGKWNCAHGNALDDNPLPLLDYKAQCAGCPAHLYIPDLIHGAQTDAGDGWVEYKMADGSNYRDGVAK